MHVKDWHDFPPEVLKRMAELNPESEIAQLLKAEQEGEESKNLDALVLSIEEQEKRLEAQDRLLEELLRMQPQIIHRSMDIPWKHIGWLVFCGYLAYIIAHG